MADPNRSQKLFICIIWYHFIICIICSYLVVTSSITNIFSLLRALR